MTNITVANMLYLVVRLGIIGLLFWLAWWFIDMLGLPEPFNKVIKAIIGLCAIAYLARMLLTMGI